MSSPEHIRIDATALRAAAAPGALKIVRRIKAAGGSAYLVGGCLRDLISGRTPKDWDVATNLRPEEVKPLFPKVREVGAAFGTLLVPIHGEIFEVTSFRTDGIYSDGRHPDEIAYADNLHTDLERRDFTINAMAWDPDADQIEDPFGGLADLEAGLIRAVGDPRDRFREDALRLMRAIRFTAQLGFQLEAATWEAVCAESAGLERISTERIREELNHILRTPKPSAALLLLQESGLLRIFMPELDACLGVEQNRFHSHDVLMHLLLAVDAAPEDSLIVRLAALLHDIGKPDTREEREGDYTFYAHQVFGARTVDRILRRLTYPNEVRKSVAHLVYHHMFYYEPEWTDSAVRRFARTVGLENIPDLIALRIADMDSNRRKAGNRAPLDALLARVQAVIAKDTALSVKDLAIGGHELMALGVPGGPGIGRILRALLERVLDEPEFNTPEQLSTEAQVLMADGYHLRAEQKRAE